ncbi:MAG: DUF3048 domain-containing protein [Acidimicrobiales bacterium]
MPELSRRQWTIAAAIFGVIVLMAALVVLATSGGDDEDVVASTTTSESTTTTSTTAPPGPTWPLTGLPLEDETLAQRPALVVKIDNAEPRSGRGGRPQAGINQADIVFEEMVEGSVTRFASVFHSADVDPVGPVRSARTTDLLILQSLNRPLFAWSGANARVAGEVRGADLVDVGFDAATGAFYRASDRPAPYNLFSSTGALRGSVPDEARPPVPQFTYREEGQAPEGGRSVDRVNIDFGGGPGGAPVDYEWDGSGWARSQRGDPHVDADGARVSPPNVIIRFTPYVEVQCCDAAGFPILEAQLAGEGDAWILTDGQLVEGRWSQPSLDAPAEFTGADGRPVGLTPGRTWVAIAPPGSATAG